MIVVIGQPALRLTADGPEAAGSAARIAMSAAGRGAPVQLIGKVGEDPDGDALVLALARADVGHVALLRDSGRRTPQLIDAPDDLDETAPQLTPPDPTERPQVDAADVDLGLRYLTEFRVIVVVQAIDAELGRVVSEAAAYGAATLIALVPDGTSAPDSLPDNALVLAAPPEDPDGAFDRLVGDLAAAIDAGTDPQRAFRDLVAGVGWEPAGA